MSNIKNQSKFWIEGGAHHHNFFTTKNKSTYSMNDIHKNRFP